MKARVVGAALGLCAVFGFTETNVALAADAPGGAMAAYYDSTLIRANDNSDMRVWYDKDGAVKRFSYEKTKPEGSFNVQGQEGKYRFAGGKMCETLVPATKETCADFAPHKVGDTWDATENGVTYHYRLVAGRTTR